MSFSDWKNAKYGNTSNKKKKKDEEKYASFSEWKNAKYGVTDDDIAPVKSQTTKISPVDKWKSLISSNDYDTYSKPTGSKRKDVGWKFWEDSGDDKYDFINNINNYRDIVGMTSAGTGQKEKYGNYTRYSYMTPEQVGNYNYIYAKYGKDKADEYLKDFEEEMNKSYGKDLADKTPGGGKGLVNILAKAEEAGNKVVEALTGDEHPTTQLQYQAEAIKEENAKREAERANRTRETINAEWKKLIDNKDYATLSQATGSKEKESWWKFWEDTGDDKYAFINNIDGYRDKIINGSENNAWAETAISKSLEFVAPQTDSESNKEQKYGKYQMMTAEEIGMYNYLYAKHGKDKAEEYLSDLEEKLNEAYAKDMYEDAHWVGKAFAWFPAGMSGFKDDVKQFFSSDELPTSETEFFSQLAKEEAYDTNPLLGLLYDSGEMIARQIPSILASYATGGATSVAGFSDDAAKIVTRIAGAIPTLISSAGGSYKDALSEGKDKGEARVYSSIVGTLEAGLQYALSGIEGMTGVGTDKLMSKVATMKDGVAKVLAHHGLRIGAEITEEELQLFLEPLVATVIFGEDYDAPTIEEMVKTAFVTAISTGAINTVSDIGDGGRVNGFTTEEARVVEKYYEDEVKKAEENGEKLTSKGKNKLRESIIERMNTGQLDTDTIEEVLGGKTYETYKSSTDKENALKRQLEELDNEINTILDKENPTIRDSERLTEARNELADVKKQLQGIDTKTIKSRLSDEVFGIVKNSRLAETYNDKAKKSQAFKADLTKYTGKQKEAVQRAIDSGVINNSYRSHQFVDILSKIEADKGITIDYADNEKLKEFGYYVEGKTVNGYVKDGAVTLNVQSSKAWQSTVGHEITHILEGTDAYTELRNALYVYAESKGELQSRRANLTELYKDMDADVEAELTADLVGDYLFNDKDFINHITGNRNLFQKIYDEIKYLWNVATGKEKAEIEKVKKAFDEAWKELSVKDNKKTTAKTNSDTDVGIVADGNVSFSISETKDGRFVAVVDSDILEGIDTTSWDKTKKETAKKAASKALKQFSEGIVVDGVTRKVNRTSRREYTRSEDTEKLYRNAPDVFADKMRIADIADDIVVATTNWNRDGGLVHPREDNFVDFDHGTTLIMSGDSKYIAEVVVGITQNGDAVFYDVVNMTPTTFEIKNAETSTTATTQNAIGDINEISAEDILPQNSNDVKSENDGFTDSNVKYSIREEAPPKETGLAYKVFFVKDGKLYPPMVANPDGADTPMGVWLNADVGTAAPPSKTGRAQVKAGGKGTQGGSGSLAYRPGWHLGDLPRASQFDRVNPETGKKELFPENFVWAEVEYAKDVDYQEEAMSYGYTENGKFRHAYAGLPKVPENGYYRYRTNPKPDTVPWVITGAMKVNRLLSDAEVNEILEKNGVPPVHRKGGDVGLDKFGFDESGKVKYSISPETDAEYMLAVENGDTETAQRLVNEAAEKSGYTTNTDYKIGHHAPVAQIDKEYFTDLDKLQELQEESYDLNLYAIANGISLQPDDYFSPNGARWYMYNDADGMESYRAIKPAINSIQQQMEQYGEVKEMPTITVYRAVPKSLKETKMQSGGQWVTPSYQYAVKHGNNALNGNYKIIKETVSAENLWWDANDIREWGFDDGTNYAYRDTKNNRKLLDAVTYDDEGNVIPLSKRFNYRNADERYSISNEGEEFAPLGNFSTPLKDLALVKDDVADVAEDVAPTQDNNTNVITDDFVEDVAPMPDEITPMTEEEANAVQDAKTQADANVEGEPKTRKQLHNNIINKIKSTFSGKGYDFDKVLKEAKNLSTFSTVDNIPQRVMEKALGYKEGQVLSDLTVNKVAQNETEGIKWLNSFTDRKIGVLARISKEYNIKPGSKKSAAAQMYAEGFYVNDNEEIIAYGDAELAQDFPDAKVRSNIKGLANDPRIRQIYDETLDAINESRKRNAYPEIQKLENYFLHFRAMDDTFSKLGLPFNPNDIRAKDLPTDLNGVTADLKPGQPYFASAMHRKGKRTSFDLLGGLERYLTSAKNQIYHIDDIQTLRALRNYIADTYGQAHGLESLDLLTEEEAQERIKEVYGSHLSTFAKFLNEEANVLAGKTALIDRGIEGILGRRGMTFLDTVNKQTGSNMVGFNISSSLTNFIPVAQTFAKTNKFDFTKAFAQTVSNKLSSIYGKGDNFAENSPVMIRRKGADRFYRTPFQKVADAGYVFMSAVDNISTELIARTKYNEFVRKGMDEQQAHFETDKWVSRLMGDRSLGQMPQLYNSKTLGVFTKFQLEVRNQLDSQFYDTIQEAKVSNEEIQNGLVRNAKTAAKITSTFAQLAVAQHLFGKAFESIAGYNPAFDIISVLATMFGFDDDEESEDTALDNLEQGFLELLEDLPYTSTFTGGRIPISNALPIKELIKGEDSYGNEKSRLETLKEIAPYYVLPGGYGQIKKTVQGLGMFSDDHPVSGSYTDSGNLRFPVEDTPLNRVQAAIFGQYASENAREYFDNDYAPLKKKQIQEYIDVDMPIKDYWEYREGLAKQEKLEDKFDYIAGLDLPVYKKNILINNVVDRKDEVNLEGYEDFANYEEYDYAVKNPEKYAFSKAVGGYSSFKTYSSDLNDIKADKDAYGKSISGSRKQKVLDYINNLDADYYTKIILYKSEYPSDDTYNMEIIDYLNSREDITYDDMVSILTYLDFTVDAEGNVYWD